VTAICCGSSSAKSRCPNAGAGGEGLVSSWASDRAVEGGEGSGGINSLPVPARDWRRRKASNPATRASRPAAPAAQAHQGSDALGLPEDVSPASAAGSGGFGEGELDASPAAGDGSGAGNSADAAPAGRAAEGGGSAAPPVVGVGCAAVLGAGDAADNGWTTGVPSACGSGVAVAAGVGVAVGEGGGVGVGLGVATRGGGASSTTGPCTSGVSLAEGGRRKSETCAEAAKAQRPNAEAPASRSFQCVILPLLTSTFRLRRRRR